MRILQCMASLDPNKGGPSVAAIALSDALSHLGHDVEVLSHDDGAASKSPESQIAGSYLVRRFKLTQAAWQYSWDYHRYLRNNIRSFDFVLIHSNFLAHTYLASRYARKSGVPYAVRPHGSFNSGDQRKNRLVKYIYLQTIERATRRHARFVFCTSGSEAEQAQKWFKAETVVIPLGADHITYSDARVDKTRNIILYLGRITPKKRIDLVIDGYASYRSQKGGTLTLVVAGAEAPTDKEQVQRLAARAGVTNDVTVLGFVEGSEKADLLKSAKLFILPSDHENFGIGVAEAMAAEVPVVITKGVSHSELVQKYRAGLVIDQTIESVADGLAQITGLSDDEYMQMSSFAGRLVSDNYSWRQTAAKLLSEIHRSSGAHRVGPAA